MCVGFDIQRIEERDTMVTAKEYPSVVSFAAGLLVILVSQGSIGLVEILDFGMLVDK